MPAEFRSYLETKVQKIASLYTVAQKFRLQRILQFLSKVFMRTHIGPILSAYHILPRLDAARRMPSSSVALPGKTTVYFLVLPHCHVPKRVFFHPPPHWFVSKTGLGRTRRTLGSLYSIAKLFFFWAIPAIPRQGKRTLFLNREGGRERRLFLEAVPFLRRCEAVSQVKSFLALFCFFGGKKGKVHPDLFFLLLFSDFVVGRSSKTCFSIRRSVLSPHCLLLSSITAG